VTEQADKFSAAVDAGKEAYKQNATAPASTAAGNEQAPL